MSNIALQTYTHKEIWGKAKEALISYIGTMSESGNKTLILLSGGSSTKLYPTFIDLINQKKMTKDLFTFAQVDERFQPEDLGSVNSHDIGRTGLWSACDKHEISYAVISQQGDLLHAVSEYETRIDSLFKLHPNRVAILGIGPDCHTAGLLPGYKHEWDRQALVCGYENRGLYPKRISITPKALHELTLAFVVSCGEGKKEAVQNALEKENVSLVDHYPAVLLQSLQRVELFTDALPENISLRQ